MVILTVVILAEIRSVFVSELIFCVPVFMPVFAICSCGYIHQWISQYECLYVRSFGYFANGLLYRYGVNPGLRLFIDHVICSDTRSGLSSPFIVNLSVILPAKFIEGIAGLASATK